MPGKRRKYIFVIGGVLSGVGKGIATSSIGAILEARGYNVNLVKVDPYLNVDAGTMNPTEHGEVFVMEKGLETDQDMGNYERFLGRNLRDEDYMTSGMVYRSVIERERNLGYGGKCIEAIPDIRDEIMARIRNASDVHDADVTVCEIGGTVGDYQNIMFIEAARTLEVQNPDDVLFIMVSYLPIPGNLGEMKTRPTQNAIRQLNSYGVQPDIIIARSKLSLDEKRKEKIANTCNIKAQQVISAPDIESIYEVPLNFEKDNLGKIILSCLKMEESNGNGTDLSKWEDFMEKVHSADKPVKIAMVGKYFDTGDFVLSDVYLSVIEALKFSSYHLGAKPEIDWINSKDIESDKVSLESLKEYDGVLIPGGFGATGIEGKIQVIKYARENKIPYFGLCYGMQLLVVEYARHVAGMKGAHTVEIEENAEYPVIDIMPEQREKLAQDEYGGTMRLGAYSASIEKGTVAHGAYRDTTVSERHRHRYEVNPDFVSRLKDAGLVFSGTSPDGVLMEIAELPKSEHPFFVGTQFHPEFQARLFTPHPLFSAFIQAALDQRN